MASRVPTCLLLLESGDLIPINCTSMKTPPALRGGRFHSKVAFCHDRAARGYRDCARGCGSSLEDTRESRLHATQGTSDNARYRAANGLGQCRGCALSTQRKSESAVALPLLILRFNALGSAW